MAYPAKTERNREIVARYTAGETLHALAADFGISPTRVHTIVSRHGARKPAMNGKRGTGARLRGLSEERRADYLALRDAMGAAYARQAMGVDA